MRASFIDPGAAPNLAAYTALEPKHPLFETNKRVGAINGADADARKKAARASAGMDFDDPDEAPTGVLNAILWHDVKGWKTPYPEVRHSLFFPLAVMISDEDRKQRKPQ
jgi:hypothetical protein